MLAVDAAGVRRRGGEARQPLVEEGREGGEHIGRLYGAPSDRKGAVVMPRLFNRMPDYWSHKFIVAGITFQMFLGRMIPKSIRRMCSARLGFST